MARCVEFASKYAPIIALNNLTNSLLYSIVFKKFTRDIIYERLQNFSRW